MKRATLLALLAMTMAVGLTPAMSADALDATLDTCWSCHGANGASKDPSVPIVWGQNAKYLEKQIRDFRSGDRDSQIMSSMAESIKRDDIARAAGLIASKAWPKLPDLSTADVPAAIAVCQGCHGAELMGGESPEGYAPRLAGQFPTYLGDQMSAFARGERANQKTMTTIMKSLRADDQAKLAAYIGGL